MNGYIKKGDGLPTITDDPRSFVFHPGRTRENMRTGADYLLAKRERYLRIRDDESFKRASNLLLKMQEYFENVHDDKYAQKVRQAMAL